MMEEISLKGVVIYHNHRKVIFKLNNKADAKLVYEALRDGQVLQWQRLKV